jgi:hypothetical protein
VRMSAPLRRREESRDGKDAEFMIKNVVVGEPIAGRTAGLPEKTGRTRILSGSGDRALGYSKSSQVSSRRHREESQTLQLRDASRACSLTRRWKIPARKFWAMTRGPPAQISPANALQMGATRRAILEGEQGLRDRDRRGLVGNPDAVDAAMFLDGASPGTRCNCSSQSKWRDGRDSNPRPSASFPGLNQLKLGFSGLSVALFSPFYVRLG